MRRNSHPARATSRRTPTIPQSQHRRETAICGSLSLLTGAAVGAALMYALDPEAGERRRRAAYEAASGALGSASHAVGDAYHSAAGTVGHTLQNLGEHVAGTASAAAANMPSAQDAADAGYRLLDRAGSSAASYRDAASRRAQGWLDSARSMIPQRRRPTDISAVSASVVALGAVAAGVGAMWLFDPARGRARRAWIGQKSTRVVNETGRFMFATGRHLRNKAKGYSHDAGEYVSDTAASLGETINDSGLAERVRSALGRLGAIGSAIRVAVEDGRIRLTGRCVTDDVNTVLDIVRNTPGVRGVDNSLEVGDMYPTSMPSTPNTSNLSA